MSGEELHLVESIYCRPGELVVHSVGDDVNSNTVFTVTLTHVDESSLRNSRSVRMLITVIAGYPETIPDVVISADGLSKQRITEIRDSLIASAAAFLGRPMLLDMISWMQEYLQGEYITKDLPSSSETTTTIPEVTQTHDEDVPQFVREYDPAPQYTAFLHIDHMRRQSAYIKTLTSWTDQLNLKGRLLILDRLILVLLHGCIDNIKEFILRLRTVKVDVDSRGRNCRERMMTVLCLPYPDNVEHFSDFSLMILNSSVELKDLFISKGLSKLYAEHVCPLLGKLNR